MAYNYDDSNRAFVQSLLSHSVLTFSQAQPILASIFSAHEGRSVKSADVTLDDLLSYVSAANAALSPLDLEVRSGLHQRTKERYWALVNTTSDNLTQLSTTYSADEIVFVKRLLDAMFETNNSRVTTDAEGEMSVKGKESLCVSAKEALNLVRNSGGNRRETQTTNGEAGGGGKNVSMSAHDAEGMLERLEAEGWVEKSKNGFYSLSVRGLMELKGWLVETYNETGSAGGGGGAADKIKFCHACREIITVGQRCAMASCPCRLHDICTQSFFRVQRSQKCPLCQTDWDGKHYVGEKAVTTSKGYQMGKRKSGQRPANDAEET